MELNCLNWDAFHSIELVFQLVKRQHACLALVKRLMTSRVGWTEVGSP